MSSNPPIDTYNCDPGSARFGEVCVECPPGSFSTGSIAQMCSVVPRGTIHCTCHLGGFLMLTLEQDITIPTGIQAATQTANILCLMALQTATLVGHILIMMLTSVLSDLLGHGQCEAGYYNDGGSCNAAPAGYFVPLPNSGIYYACPPGSYTADTASTYCLTTPALHYNPFTAATVPGQNCSSAVDEGAINCIEDAIFTAPISVTTLVNSTRGLDSPTDIVLAPNGLMYVTDTGNHVIRKLSTAGQMSIFAGFPGVSGLVDGAGTAAKLSSPVGIAVDTIGVVYVTDAGNFRIRRITSAGLVRTLAGSNAASIVDGVGSNANFLSLGGIAINTDRNIYVTDSNVIRQITTAGQVATVAGSNTVASYADGYGTNANFDSPTDIHVDVNGVLYVVDLGNERIRRIDVDLEVRTVTGNGLVTYIDGAGTHASLNFPSNLVTDTVGNIYFTSTGYGLVRKVETNGVVTTLTGSTQSIFFRDGLGTTAQLDGPRGITIDSTGNLYVVCQSEKSVRKLGVYNTSCPTGAFYNSHFCAETPAGYFMHSAEASSSALASTAAETSPLVYACPAGSYSSSLSSQECLSAPAGNFTPSAGQNVYYPCPNNTYGMGGGYECIPESVYPTSFPTYPVQIRYHRAPVWIYILASLLSTCVACCMVICICYFKCWRDSEEEHKEHAHRHEVEFGVEGVTTIQVHAVTDYVSPSKRAQYTPLGKDGSVSLTRPASQNSMLSNNDEVYSPNTVDPSRGRRQDTRQMTTVAVDREHVNRPVGRLPQPAQYLNVSQHSNSSGHGMVDSSHGMLSGSSSHNAPHVGTHNGHAGLPPRPGGPQRRDVHSELDDSSSITMAVPIIAGNIELMMRQNNLGGRGTTAGNSRSSSPALVRSSSPSPASSFLSQNYDSSQGCPSVQGASPGHDRRGMFHHPTPSRSRPSSASPVLPSSGHFSGYPEFDHAQSFYGTGAPGGTPQRTPSPSNPQRQPYRSQSPSQADYYQTRHSSSTPPLGPTGRRPSHNSSNGDLTASGSLTAQAIASLNRPTGSRSPSQNSIASVNSLAHL
jgi:sugar lactone lactonase YvrE